MRSGCKGGAARGNCPKGCRPQEGSDGAAMGAGAGPRRAVVVGGAPTGAPAGAGRCGGGRGGGGRMGAEPAAGPCGGGGVRGAVGGGARFRCCFRLRLRLRFRFWPGGGGCGACGACGGRCGACGHGAASGDVRAEMAAGAGAGVVGGEGSPGMATPPFGRRARPVVKAEVSVAGWSTAWAMSSGSPARPRSGIRPVRPPPAVAVRRRAGRPSAYGSAPGPPCSPVRRAGPARWRASWPAGQGGTVRLDGRAVSRWAGRASTGRASTGLSFYGVGPDWQDGHQYVGRSFLSALRTGVPQRRQGRRSLP